MHRLLVRLVDIICGQDRSNTNLEGEQQQITMLIVTAAVSVSLAIPLSANFCLTRLSV